MADNAVKDVVLVHFFNFFVELEVLENLADIGGEALDIVAQVGCDVVRVIQEGAEIKTRLVMELLPGRHIEELLELDSLRALEHGLFRRCKHTVKSAQHAKRQDDVAVALFLVRSAKHLRVVPNHVRERGKVDV